MQTKLIILSILIVAKLFIMPTSVQASYPTDLERSYTSWKYEFIRSNDMPPFVMNSYKPQGIFTKTPLYLKLR